MTIRQPLVLGADNLPQQLQVGDSLAAPMTLTSIRPVTNAESSAAVPFGTPVYATSPDNVKRAQGNAKSTSSLAGLVCDATISAGAVGNIAVEGVMVGTTTQWDAVAGTVGGLVFNSYYFLDPANVGKITSTPTYTNGSGQCNVLVGMALSTTELEMSIIKPILL